jgi:hypothetical protein
MTAAAEEARWPRLGEPKRGRNQSLLGTILYACFGPDNAAAPRMSGPAIPRNKQASTN